MTLLDQPPRGNPEVERLAWDCVGHLELSPTPTPTEAAILAAMRRGDYATAVRDYLDAAE